MAATQNPVFKFNRDSFSVKLENVADSVSRREIVDLFNNLIGEIRRCEEYTSGGRRVIGLTFHTHDAAKKALCMTGYTVAGQPLTVTAAFHAETHRPAKQGKQGDLRRNLYVLGLPFDLTEAEFVEIFSRHGTVSHAVILATVDNASRRRGFVVMNSHGEAKCAMDNLSRKEIKGHTIDVSWAVVQRSQGFLDGGDRTTVLSSNSPSPSPTPFDFRSTNSETSSGRTSISSTPAPERSPFLGFTVQAPRLLVKNLPAVLFSQVADLHPLFCPFGEIKKLEVVEASVEDLSQGNISVIVEYDSPIQAKEARDSLHGQAYSSNPVTVEFLQVPATDIDIGSFASPGDNTLLGLNPRAPAFAAPTGLSLDPMFAPVKRAYHERLNQPHTATGHQNGSLAANSYSDSPYAPSPSFYSHLRVPTAETVRPSSAPSTWGGDDFQPRLGPTSGRWAFSQLPHLSNPSTPSISAAYM